MTTLWVPVPAELSYGIAIYNFNEDIDYKLKLTVGDALHLLDEEENWYYGYIIHNRHAKGIFPKNYVHVKQCTIDANEPQPTYGPPIAAEITSVLREWGTLWKNLYVTHNKCFEEVKKQIDDLINHRSKIVSCTLPVDELKRVTKQATEEIDLGNKILGLDLVVRDRHGNLINPEEISTIQLYYHHRNATERMSKMNQPNLNETQPKTAIQQYSNIFIVAVKNFTCKMTEDAELLMTLYDGKEYKSITENYVVRWSKDGLMSDIDQMDNLRVMFTDLGKRDLEREKIYLVCYVIRNGSMDLKEVDIRRSSMSLGNKKNNSADKIRRPFGVAAMEITHFMNGNCESNLEQEFSVPFVGCEKDNLDQTLRKIISNDFAKNESKTQSLFISMKLLRGDLKQVREENPHLVSGNVAVARKMGFPEVILPGDVRNDLYLTLIKGEFTKGNKTSDKNVEVVVRVCNEKGKAIPGVIGLGGGIQPLNEYKSVMYYHEDKPHWYEAFKVAIPIDEFKTSHLKFTFKHRSSNEVKDKSEKPFAMCFVKLMQENGTTLKDARHNLVVYKIDYKKFDEKGVDYFKLPSFVNEMKGGDGGGNKSHVQQHNHVPGLILSTRDSFTISSNICSTKLTQNVDLLGLLNWASDKANLKCCLRALIKVDGEEVVKFLQDILDALFNILMDNSDTDTYDILVFDCLLHIISLVSNDWKYQHFEPVLDLYIKESFSATLAYKKLISVLKSIISKSSNIESNQKDDIVFKTMKSLQYVVRFISRSRILYINIYPDIEMDNDFIVDLRDLLRDIIYMMSSTSDAILREQGACLKYLPSTIPDILKVFDSKELSYLLCDMLKNIPPGRLTKQKMMTINDIVHSKLFLYPECRRILLPVFMKQVKLLFETCEEGDRRQDGRRQNRSVAKVAQLLGTTQHCLNQHRGYSEEVELCIKILSDILELLFSIGDEWKFDDIKEIMMTGLRTVVQTHINMRKEHPHSGNLVAVMIDLFRQMNNEHYNLYIESFKTKFDIFDFLMEILLVFKELVNELVFPLDWCDMIMLQNNVILKSLRHFSHTIRDYFSDKFEVQAWSNFFYCAIAFMTQPALQLEMFSFNKRMKIIKRYRDMRRETGFEIRSMWFNLGQYKVQFVPSLVGSILEMTLIPEPELRKATIPIFFDMMQCEFYSSKFEVESYGDTKRDSSHVKGNFHYFEDEMIARLDILVEGGKGDHDYKDLFHNIMIEHCIKHTTMKDDGIKFVKIVTRLMDRLLEYRCIIMDENKENRMSCTVNLLDFYSEINRKEMYIRYLNKLCDLHLECDNFTEAAYTLELHTKLLNWTDDPLLPILKSSRYSDAKTHRQLKAALYYTIIENYSKGKMWECAIKKCQELAKQYEEETYDYERLSELHKRMALFYDDIMKKARAYPAYFRVGYYGRGFPQFLQNKVFIYRGKEYERLQDFNGRILNEFPKAELLKKLTPPSDDVTESDKQYIQINSVDPVMDEKRKRFSGKSISNQILDYYNQNDINKFTFSRPFTRKDPNIESGNEFAQLWLERTELTTTYPLPGILRWFPVSSIQSHEISPLRNAIETIESKNKQLMNYVLAYNRDKNIQLNPLSCTLNGILDPAVMGGIKNYEEVFLTEEYKIHHPDDLVLLQRLQDLIADQIPLLQLCMQIFKEILTPDLQQLHKRMEDCLAKMQESVVEKYGKGTCNIQLENQVTMRRHNSLASDSKLSDTTLTSNDGRSRVSSLTGSQITPFKQLTASFNFTVSSSSINSKFSQNSSTRSLLLSPTKSLTNTPALNGKKSFRITKEKRRSSKIENTISPAVSTAGGASTQWYTTTSDETAPVVVTNGLPIFELTEELTPKRPLRSEVEKEKRLSRPPSGQFSRPNSTVPSNSTSVSIRGANSSGNSSNRDSVGTTDSSISEEDNNNSNVPPPLPIKLREADYCNLTSNENHSFLYSQRSSIRSVTSLHMKIVPPIPDDFNVDDDDDDNNVPPVPPPKPPKIKLKTQNIST